MESDLVTAVYHVSFGNACIFGKRWASNSSKRLSINFLPSHSSFALCNLPTPSWSGKCIFTPFVQTAIFLLWSNHSTLSTFIYSNMLHKCWPLMGLAALKTFMNHRGRPRSPVPPIASRHYRSANGNQLSTSGWCRGLERWMQLFKSFHHRLHSWEDRIWGSRVCVQECTHVFLINGHSCTSRERPMSNIGYVVCVSKICQNCADARKHERQTISTSQNQITKVPYLSLKVVRVIVSVLGVHWLLFQAFAHVAGILLAVAGYRGSGVGSNNSKSLRLWLDPCEGRSQKKDGEREWDDTVHGQVCRASPLRAVFGSRGRGGDGRRAEVRGWDSSGGVHKERRSSGTGERREGRRWEKRRGHCCDHFSGKPASSLLLMPWLWLSLSFYLSCSFFLTLSLFLSDSLCSVGSQRSLSDIPVAHFVPVWRMHKAAM